MNLSYTDQARRVVRSFKKIPAPNYPNSTPDEVWDAYYHFLQDAYHLKDWILNDDAVVIGSNREHKRKQLNAFIEGNVNMKLLQSVVTSMKHLKADYNHIAFNEINLTWSEGGLRPSPAISYGDLDFDVDDEGNFLLEEDGDTMKVEVATKTMHPKKLAVKVLVSWNKFFANHGLEGGFEIINT